MDYMAVHNPHKSELEVLHLRYHELHRQHHQLARAVNDFSLRYPHLKFVYSDPEPNFDRNKVKGPLCTLFKIKDEKFARAIQDAAGKKLYYVVVDDLNTVSKIKRRGQIQRPVTLVPLSSVLHSVKIDEYTLREIQDKFGSNNVYLAQQLIDYEPEFENLMCWTFGRTLVCSSADLAQAVWRSFKKKTVTIQGDCCFHASGIISGGAVKRYPILLVLRDFRQSEVALSEARRKMSTAYEEMNRVYQSQLQATHLLLPDE